MKFKGTVRRGPARRQKFRPQGSNAQSRIICKALAKSKEKREKRKKRGSDADKILRDSQRSV